MTAEIEVLKMAETEGLVAVLIEPKEIPINAEFRKYCEQNLCGKYNANYSCPPDCGTVEELKQKILRKEKTLVLNSQWEIAGYEDKAGIQRAKKMHNAAVLRLMDKIRKEGLEGFAVGYGGCPLCNPCKRTLNEPCAFPEKRISCMSAYCIDVAELAKRCGMEFDWNPKRLYLFGMVVYS